VANNAARLGASWEAVSTPFLYVEDGQAVSHVGIIPLPLVLLGQAVTVGTIHAVATHPNFRRQGYYRHLMDEVLHYAANRYETLILTTEHPEYFTPFGFRVIDEHFFTVRCDVTDGTEGFRLLDTHDANDLALLHRLLEVRAPVSQVVSPFKEKAIFCFNEGWRPLHYSPDLDVLACLEREGTHLTLFDLVGPTIPSLDTVLARIPDRLQQIDICFSPDRLGVSPEPTPYIFDHDGPSYLMARGPFAAEGHAFTLPRSART
jgi:GNAT superfamily N-acetyltransferase